MTKTRLEAFSDGVIAILITIMVLELKVPEEGADLQALRSLVSLFLAYVLSFVVVGIYWTNHHHMFHVTHKVNGAILWANLHLLFWLSLVPFVTWWMGRNGRATLPAAAYGVVMLACAIAWTILQGRILTEPANRAVLGAAIGSDVKGKISLALYAAAIPAAFVHPWVSDALYVAVALMWFVPDRRIESRLSE